MANNTYSRRWLRTDFLPTSRDEMEALGWDQADVILFSGDAYVDHPSFGAAVIGRTLQAAGYKVAIVPQPNWRDDLRDFRKLGRPRPLGQTQTQEGRGRDRFRHHPRRRTQRRHHSTATLRVLS